MNADELGYKTMDVSAGLRCSSECHYYMDKTVSAADADRRFSELLRTVKQGRSVVVTSHGKPVAKITPVVEDERAAEGARSALFARPAEGARSALFARPGTGRAVNAGRWMRDELYDDAS